MLHFHPMVEYITLGIIQGLGEWLPVSSDGLIVLARTHLFGNPGIAEGLRIALILHLGTFTAALIYFRREVGEVLSDLTHYRSAPKEKRSLIHFYILATLISGAIGFGILKVIEGAEEIATASARGVTILIALSLLATGVLLELKKKQQKALRSEGKTNWMDALLVGGVQGLSALPGVSRSGSTISVLLLRRFEEKAALTLSFMLSLPIVLFANIFLSYEAFFSLDLEVFAGIVAAGIVGYLTIHTFMKVAERVDFARFVFGFGILLLLSSFI